LKTVIAEEGERLKGIGKMSFFPWVLFMNKNFTGKNKPGPKVNMTKREEKVEALASKLDYFVIIPIVADALIKNWFHGCIQSYLLADGNIPIPTWYIFAGGTSPFVVTFELITDLKKGRFINPRLVVNIKFTPKISAEKSRYHKKAITFDLVYSLIIDFFEDAFGEFAQKKGLTIS
jgi:hypothetical protein